MKAKDKKAISIISAQIQKAESENFDKIYDSPTWKIHAKSLIELFLGPNSEQFKNLNRAFLSGDASYLSMSEKNEVRRDEINYDCKILESAIEIIQIKGIYKKPKLNFLSTVSENWLIFIVSLIISAMAGLFYIGYWYGQQSILTSIISNQKTEKVTNNTNGSVQSKGE